MSYTNNPFNPNTRYQGQVKTELNLANNNFQILAQAFKNGDPTTGIVSHAAIADSVANASSSAGISPLSIPYTQFYISSTQPSTPSIYDTWYNLNDNTLNYYDGSNWQQVDWTKWVSEDIWYKAGNIRINNGQLQISNDNNNWYQIFPTIGRVVEVIADDTNAGDNFKIAYLSPGQSLLVRNKKLFRAAITYPSFWRGELFYYQPGAYTSGILPSNISGSDGVIKTIYALGSSSPSANTSSSLSYLTIAKNIYSGVFKSFSVMLLKSSNTIYYDMVAQGFGSANASTTPDAEIAFSRITFPTNGYFIGSFYYNNATTNIDYALFTRSM
jgi:hypothetical protein